MEDKTTDDLSNEMMSNASLDSYLRDNQPFFSDLSVTELLSTLFKEKSVTKSALAKRSGMSEVYLHQVFSGRRTPSRDRLLCLCFGLEVTLDETQRLLKQAGYALIYPKMKRDAIISYGIVHHMPLNAINDKLFAENQKTLL
ncbi:MAG: helix-turn-helix transcriptional regulator [Evtepia sp.]